MITGFRIGATNLIGRLAIRAFWLGKLPADMEIVDQTMPVENGRIRLRVYKPRGTGPFPVVHFFHGGGWVFGNLETHDPLCRDLCAQTGHLVIAFDYRCAPKHAFPIPVQDCLASLEWTRNNAARFGGDPQRIVLCGDSAGGNLAAVAVQQARHLAPGMIKGQVLIYPATNYYADAQWSSYKKYGGKEYGLNHDSLVRLWGAYVDGSPLWPPGTRRHELATPLHVPDLGGMPRTLIVLAAEDVLHDEGAAYGERLREAGTDVQVRSYPGRRHGFVGVKPDAGHQQVIADIATWLS